MSIKLATNSLSHKATNSYESTGQRDVVFWFYFVFFWGGVYIYEYLSLYNVKYKELPHISQSLGGDWPIFRK